MRYKDQIIDLTILLITSIIFYHSWFLPGNIRWGDFGSWFNEKAADYIEKPYLWDSTMNGGWYSLLGIPFYPVLHIEGLLTLINVDFNIFSRLFFFYPFVLLTPIFMYLLTYHLFKNRIVSFFSSLLFSLNTYIMLISSGGQVLIAVSYCLSPLLLLTFIKLVETSKLKYLFFLAIVFAIMAAYDLRLLYINILIIGLYLLFNSSSKKDFFYSLTKLSVSMVLFLLMFSYFIIPAILVESPRLPDDYTNDNFILSGLKMYHTMFLVHSAWITNAYFPFFDKSITSPVFLLLPLTLLSLIYFKNKKTLFFSMIYLLGAFITKSINPPFGFIYKLLFNNLPGFSLFRDASKFYLMVLFGISVLLGISVMLLVKRFKMYKKIILIVVFLLITSSYYPFLLNQPFATLNPKPIPTDYVQLKNYIMMQEEGYFTYFLPWFSTIAFNDVAHPWINFNTFSDNLRYFFSIYNPSTVLINQSMYIDEIFGLYGVKNVVLLRDPELASFVGGLSFEEYERVLLAQGLSESARFGNFSVYNISNSSKELFLSTNPIYIVGGLDTLLLIKQLGLSLPNNLFFFNNVNSGFELNASKLVIFNEKGLDELVFSLNHNYFSKDYEYEITNENTNFDLKSPEIMFNQNNRLVNLNLTVTNVSEKVLIRGIFNSSNRFIWLDLDSFKLTVPFNISFDDIILDVVVKINRSVYEKLITDTLLMISKKELIIFGENDLNQSLNLTENNFNGLIYRSNTKLPLYNDTTLVYEKLDRVSYSFNVSESKPCFITLSNNYDNNWCVGDFCSVKGNMVFNSIYLDNCSHENLVLSYKPQKVMDFASTVSLVSFLIIVFLLMIAIKLDK